MRNRIASSLLFTALTVDPSPALATAQYEGDVTVQNVTLENGTPYLTVAGGLNPASCTNSTIVALPNTAEKDRYISMALTAIAADMKLQIWVDGCVATPWGTVAAAYFTSVHR